MLVYEVPVLFPFLEASENGTATSVSALGEQRWAEVADMAEFLSLMGQLLNVLARQREREREREHPVKCRCCSVNLYLSFLFN